MAEGRNRWKKATLWFMGAITFAVIVYDVFVAFFNEEQGDTISRAVQSISEGNWSLPFATGVLFIGHFFLYGRPLLGQPWAFITASGILVSLIAADFLGLTPVVSPLIPLSVGAIVGRYLWPMSPL